MAAKKQYKGVVFTTPEGRLSYPALFTPALTYNGRTKGTGEKEFKVELLWDKATDLKPFKAACKKAIEEVYGPESGGKWPKNIVYPFKDQQETIDKLEEQDKAIPDHLESGAYFCNFKTGVKFPPIVVGRDRQVIMDENEVYGGAYGKVNCCIKCNFIPSTKILYVSAYLQGVQKTKDGEPFGNRPDAASMFEAVEDESEGQSLVD